MKLTQPVALVTAVALAAFFILVISTKGPLVKDGVDDDVNDINVPQWIHEQELRLEILDSLTTAQREAIWSALNHGQRLSLAALPTALPSLQQAAQAPNSLTKSQTKYVDQIIKEGEKSKGTLDRWRTIRGGKKIIAAVLSAKGLYELAADGCRRLDLLPPIFVGTEEPKVRGDLEMLPTNFGCAPEADGGKECTVRLRINNVSKLPVHLAADDESLVLVDQEGRQFYFIQQIPKLTERFFQPGIAEEINISFATAADSDPVEAVIHGGWCQSLKFAVEPLPPL